MDFFNDKLKKNGDKYKLIRRFSIKNEIDIYDLNVIAGKYCPGLADCAYSQSGKNHQLEYVIESNTTVEQFLKKERNTERILKVLYYSSKTFFNCDFHKLHFDRIDFKLSHVFVTNECKTIFIYCPVKSIKGTEKPFDFFKQIFAKLRTGDTRILQLRSLLADPQTFSFQDFCKMVGAFVNKKIEIDNKVQFDSLKGNESKEDVNRFMTSRQSNEDEGTTLLSQQDYGDEGTTLLSQQDYEDEGTTLLSQQIYEDEGSTLLSQQVYEDEGTTLLSQQVYEDEGTTLLNSQTVEDEGTTLLSQHPYDISNKETLDQESSAAKRIFYLIRCKTGERIQISKLNFVVGSQEQAVDYVIRDNTSISKVHAAFLQKADRLFIIDRNSTNKTFLNGIELTPYKEEEITDGSLIMISDEAFLIE